MKRPTAAASVESWARIWLGTMDNSFNRGSGMSGSGKVSKRCTKWTYIDRKKDRLGTSLHQMSAGHGYSAGDNVVSHLPSRYDHHSCLLGGSPREAQTAMQYSHIKRFGKD